MVAKFFIFRFIFLETNVYNKMYNTKLVNDLNKRKLFKKHIFHDNNIEEEYTGMTTTSHMVIK